MRKGGVYYDEAAGHVYDMQGLTLTDGGSNYAWSFIKVNVSDLEVLSDY